LEEMPRSISTRRTGRRRSGHTLVW